MPLQVLQAFELPAQQNFLQFEVTFSGRCVRPSLSSHGSVTSTSTNDSSSSQRSRPTLLPEALLTHAYGPSALKRVKPASSPITTCTQISEGHSPSSTRTSSTRSSSTERSHRDSYPTPPPRGTFRSAAKPPKKIATQLSLSELGPFQLHSSSSVVEGEENGSPRKDKDTNERERPMSQEEWREKAEERQMRRKLLRLKVALTDVVKMPLDIDCRPMRGSMGLPPASNIPKAKNRMPERTTSAPTLKEEMFRGRNEALSEKSEIAKKSEIKEAPLRSTSTLELSRIEELTRRSSAMSLKDPPG